jgi:hypothetical protein
MQFVRNAELGRVGAACVSNKLLFLRCRDRLAGVTVSAS